MYLAIHIVFYTLAAFLSWVVISQFIYITLPAAIAVAGLAFAFDSAMDALAGLYP